MKQNPIKEGLMMVLRACSWRIVGFLLAMVALVIISMIDFRNLPRYLNGELRLSLRWMQ